MMNAHDYIQYDALGLAELVAHRETTPQELAATARQQHEKLTPQHNAVLQWLDPQIDARHQAGAFYGVPFLIKELVLHAAGVRHDMGSALAQGMVSPDDTELMARFRRAGLCLTGTTQTPEFGFSPTTETRLHGPVHNPWKRGHSAGGSSGGSAAAVAAGIVPVAHANDAGGSIRIPAGACGLVGLKPSRDRIPHGPDIGDALNGLATEFVVTRSVRDSAAMLDAVGGADPGATGMPVPPAAPYRELIGRAPRKLRIAWTAASPAGTPIEAECVTAVHDTVRLLNDLGHITEEAAPQYDWGLFLQASHVHWVSYVAWWIDMLAAGLGRPVDLSTVEAGTLAVWEQGRQMKASDLYMAFAISNQVSRAFGQFFTGYDVLLSPTIAQQPAAHGVLDQNRAGMTANDWTNQAFAYCPFTPQFNMTGQPAISLPLHWAASGLPVGVHFGGRFGDEATLLQLAAQLEQARPWQQRQLALMKQLLDA
jgi:amidase